MPICKKLFDDATELRVFVKGFREVLLKLLELEMTSTTRSVNGGERRDVRTNLVVDMYDASTACPVFSIAVASAPLSLRLNPFNAAPSSE